jgi:hypothetical protein
MRQLHISTHGRALMHAQLFDECGHTRGLVEATLTGASMRACTLGMPRKHTYTTVYASAPVASSCSTVTASQVSTGVNDTTLGTQPHQHHKTAAEQVNVYEVLTCFKHPIGTQRMGGSGPSTRRVSTMMVSHS